jgi:hypothetical protein
MGALSKMANTVKIKQSAVPLRVPTTSDLALGELGVNTYDGKLYTRKDSGTPSIIEIGASSASTPILENLQTVSTSKTLTASSNGISLGPITVNTSITVTIGTSQRWMIL